MSTSPPFRITKNCIWRAPQMLYLWSRKWGGATYYNAKSHILRHWRFHLSFIQMNTSHRYSICGYVQSSSNSESVITNSWGGSIYCNEKGQTVRQVTKRRWHPKGNLQLDWPSHPPPSKFRITDTVFEDLTRVPQILYLWFRKWGGRLGPLTIIQSSTY